MERYVIQQISGLEPKDIRYELRDTHSGHQLGWSSYKYELEDIKHLLDSL
jgi:hypothetical protein